MDNDQFAELSAWITEAGLAGQSESAILAGFCEREVARGLPLARALVLIDTLHPIYEGRAFRWTRAQKETTLTEYGRSDDDLSRWQRSPFYRLEESGEPLLRRHLTAETEPEFSIFADLRADGMTDYVAIANRFTGDEIIGRMDCIYSSWATDASPRSQRSPRSWRYGRTTSPSSVSIVVAAMMRSRIAWARGSSKSSSVAASSCRPCSIESAGALGMEAKNPQKNIGRAIILSAVIVGVFYMIVSYSQVLGFQGTDQFAKSSAPMPRRYCDSSSIRSKPAGSGPPTRNWTAAAPLSLPDPGFCGVAGPAPLPDKSLHCTLLADQHAAVLEDSPPGRHEPVRPQMGVAAKPPAAGESSLT